MKKTFIAGMALATLATLASAQTLTCKTAANIDFINGDIVSSHEESEMKTAADQTSRYKIVKNGSTIMVTDYNLESGVIYDTDEYTIEEEDEKGFYAGRRSYGKTKFSAILEKSFDKISFFKIKNEKTINGSREKMNLVIMSCEGK